MSILLLQSGWGSEVPTGRAIAIAFAAAGAVYGFWRYSNRVPRTPAGRVGFLIALSGDDETHDRQLKSDFVAHLRQLLDQDKDTTHVHVIELPRWLAERCTDTESGTRILAESRGHILIYGVAKKRVLRGQDSHLIEMAGVVRHAPISMDASAALGHDFRSVLPHKWFFPVDNDAFAFAASSQLTDVAARYVVGLAALYSGDVRYAERLLLSVEKRLRQSGSGAAMREVARRLPERFKQTYGAWLSALYDAYLASRERRFVEEADEVAKKFIARDPNNVPALLFKAIADFVLRRDVQSAIQAVRGCRRVCDQIWRYSYAFLLAYQGQTRRAREEYELAFNGRLENPTVPVQCEEFIDLVLAEEPDKVQLHFFSGLINLRAKEDSQSAASDFESFLAAPGSLAFPEEVTIAKKHLQDIQAHIEN